MYDKKQWVKWIPMFMDEDSSVAANFTEELPVIISG